MFCDCSTPDDFESSSRRSPRYGIRSAQTQDLHGLAEVLADSFHSRSGWQSWIYPLLRLGIYEDLRSRLQNASCHYVCLVALEISPSKTIQPLVGTVELALRVGNWGAIAASPHAQRHLYISNLAVRASERRQGVATALLKACEDLALEWGFQDLYLHVLENNHRARRLYFKAGYRLQHADWNWGTWCFKQPRRLLLHKHLIHPRPPV